MASHLTTLYFKSFRLQAGCALQSQWPDWAFTDLTFQAAESPAHADVVASPVLAPETTSPGTHDDRAHRGGECLGSR